MTFLLVVTGWQIISSLPAARRRTLPLDPSIRVSSYIQKHSKPTDRIFVWGFHPDIYLHANRGPASRYLFATIISGLIPWSNTAPDKDTAYAIVPGAIDALLQDLAFNQPLLIVDCSAGPNRFWDKYPLEKFPRLNQYLVANYETIESGQFVPQGFRLFHRRSAGSPPVQAATTVMPPGNTRALAIGTLGLSVLPAEVSAPLGVGFPINEGRAEYFAHAPSRLVYRIAAGATGIRGGCGIRPEA